MDMTAEKKRPGTKRLCHLCFSVFRRAIIEYDMIDVEKCTTIYIVSIRNISQSLISGCPYSFIA